jgi:hypothetical protein
VVRQVLRLDRKAPSSTATPPSSGLGQCVANGASAVIGTAGAIPLTGFRGRYRCGSLRSPTCPGAAAPLADDPDRA